MPFLSAITITQFKNYPLSTFHFKERVIGICGPNGKGKTNLLDAIYYLCFTKSYFAATDALNIQFENDGFRLEGLFDNSKIVCIYRGTGKKEFYADDIAYEKFSEHIGRYPAVMVAPDDVELITGASSERRRYIDTILSQTDKKYIQGLITYNRVLLQRNSLLKSFAETSTTNWPLLETLDLQLSDPGNYIHQKRKELTEWLIPLVQDFYHQLAGQQEVVSLQYESQINEQDFLLLLQQCRQKDCVLQRSTAGIHKDDVAVQLNGHPFKTTASQGQRKSLLFALKLAEYEILKTSKGFAPLLLLDDVFEKLDDDRMNHLLQWVSTKEAGQVFITDTHKPRLQQAFAKLNTPLQLISL